jgi:hypothetical protein
MIASYLRERNTVIHPLLAIAVGTMKNPNFFVPRYRGKLLRSAVSLWQERFLHAHALTGAFGSQLSWSFPSFALPLANTPLRDPDPGWVYASP